MAAALARVGGDEELLSEIAEIFLDQCPEALSEVRAAVESKDPVTLQEAAHSLKGSVGNFGAKDAFDAALRLEMMGRQQNLTDSTAALADLERALENLQPQLSKLVSG
jgi:HPt (histidine-containing phosphotransfer) domain-containing protein